MQTHIKKYFLITLLVLFVVPLSILAQDNPPPPDNNGPIAPQPVQVDNTQQPVTLQTFYDQLAPYGQWVNWPNYGYVFIPSVAPGFTPYSTAGHWVYDNTYGWTWASDYAWGWAAFHYGRWNYDPSYGWFWIPDLNWGPAWVAWRNCTGYYGWAPLPWGVSISVGFSNFYIAPEHWCFVPQEHICELNLGAFFIPRVHNDVFIRNSVIIDRMDYDNHRRFGYFKGPDRVEVERYVNHPVTVIRADQYRYPNRTVIVNNVRHDDDHHMDNQQRHDDHQMQNNDRHDDNRGMQRQSNNYTPARYVESRNVPQRGRH